MSAVGYASMPMIPTFEGITQVLEKELGQPLQAAAQKAGSQFESSLVKSAESAAGKVEKARQKEVRAAQNVAKAEKQVEDAKFAVEQATAKVEQAEISRERANSKAAAAVRKAEQDLASVMGNSESSVEDITRAQEKLNDARLGEQQTAIREEAKLERALKSSQDATDKAEKASRDLGDERARAEGAAKNLKDAEQNLDRAQEDASDSAKTLGERLRSMGDEALEAGEKSGGLGQKLMDGFRKIGTGALLGVGAKIGTTVTEGIGTAFSSGFDRLASVEQAESMLGGLGHTAEATAEIMDNAMDSVKGTAFGFGEAASMAATFVGAGIPEGEALTDVLTLVGDSAAIAGSDLNEMGSIWTKVATGGRLGTEEMNQLMDRGLGLLPKLQEHYNVTAEEARKMVTDGEVSFEDFSEIMEDMVGGSAQAMGDTFSGSAANMRAALGRLGSQLLAPVFDNAPAIFQAIGGAVDKLGEYLAPVIEQWSERLQPVIERFAEELGPALESAIENTAEAIKASIGWLQENRTWLEAVAIAAGVVATGIALMNLQNKIMMAGGLLKWMQTWTVVTNVQAGAQRALNFVMRMNPIGIIITAVAALAAGFVYLFSKTEAGRELWSKFTSALASGWEWVMDKIGAGIDWIREKWADFTGWISTAWEGITALVGEGDYTSALRDAFGIEEDDPIMIGFFRVRDAITGLKDLIVDGDFSGALRNAFGWEEDHPMVNGILNVRDGLIGLRDLIVDGDFSGALRNAFGWEEDHPMVNGILTIRDVVINTFDTIKDNARIAVDVIKDIFGGLWSLITGDMDGLKEHARSALDGVSEIFSNAWTMIKENASMLLGTIWRALGIEEGGILDTYLSGAWEIFSRTFETVKQNLLDWADGAWSAIKGVFAFVTGDFDGMKAHFSDAFDSVKDIASRTWSTVKENVSTAWESFKIIAPQLWDGVKEQAGNAWDSVTSTVSDKASEMWSGVKDGARTAFDWASDNEITGPAVGAISAIGEGIGEKWGEFNEKVQPLKDSVADLWGTLRGNGEDQEEGEERSGIAGFVDSFTEKVGELQEKFQPVQDAAQNLWDVLRGRTDEVSEDAEGGLAGMIESFTGNVADLQEKMQPAVDAVKRVWNALRGKDDNGNDLEDGEEEGGIAGLVSTITEKITEFRDAAQPIIDRFKEKWDELKEAVQPMLDRVSEKTGEIASKIGGATLVIAIGLLLSPFIILAGVIYGAVTALVAIADAFGWVSEKWAEMKDWLSTTWEDLKADVFDAFETAIQSVSDKFTEIKDWISKKWDELVANLERGWQWIEYEVLIPLRASLEHLWEKVLEVVDWIVGKWDELVANLERGWQWIEYEVLIPLRASLEHLWEKVLEVVDWIVGKWDELVANLERGWNWINDNVFAPLGRGLETVQGWFDAAVEGIGRIWDGLRAAAARPVRFVIDTVWNNGILAAWNAIARFLPGIEEKDPVPLGELGSYARGTDSIVPGSRSVGRDNMRFISSDGRYGINLAGHEGIGHQHLVEGLGGKDTWNRLNHVARTGGPQAVRQELGGFHRGGLIELGSYARGGTINPGVSITTDIQRAMMDIVWGKYPNIVLSSATRHGHSGYHGSGLATDWATAGAYGNSQEQLALAHDIATTYPGSAELIYDHPGWTGNLNNGSNVGAFGQFYTMAQAGPHHHHVHWAMTTPPTMPFGGGVFEGGSGGGAIGNAINWLAERARGVWDDMVSPITGLIDNQLGRWGDSDFAQIPGAMLTSLKDAAWEKISSLFGGGGTKVDTSGVVGSNVEIGKQLAEQVGWTGAEWEALKELWTLESNWDNHAQNPVSTAYGIPQFLDQTWATVGYQKTSDPATQIAAGIEYIQGRPDYGGLPSNALAAWWSRDPHWYDRGGWLNPGTTLVQNDTGRPEPVFNPAQWDDIRALINAIADLHPELRRMVDIVTPQIEHAIDSLNSMAAHMQKIADPESVEGMTARGITQRILDMDVLTYGSTIQAFLDAEQTLIAAREAQVSRASAVTDAEEALAAARAELAALGEVEAGVSVENQEKINDAEKALEEAKTAHAEAESDKQAAAAEKVTEAEEKLRQVREEVAADTDAEAVKRSEEIEQATESVTKAENDLIKARQEQVKALDAPLYSVLPQLSDGLSAASSDLAGLAAQAAGLGGIATQAVPALAGFSAQLASAAAWAGPAGISINMALTGLKVAIGLIREVADLITRLQERYFSAIDAGHQAVRDYFASVVQWQEMVEAQQTSVSNLQQQVIRDTMAMEQAQWSLRRAQFDRLVAERTGITATTRAAEALWDYEERARLSAEIGLRGLTGAADRLRWMSQDALAAAADAVEETSEWRALAYEYFAASAAAEAERLSAEMSTLQAWHDMQVSALQLQRSQEDLVRSTAVLSRMTTSFGLTLQQATVGQELAAVQQEIGEREANKWSLGSIVTRGLGRLMDWDGDGKTFGIQNPFSTIRVAQDKQLQDLYDYRERLMGLDDAPEMNTGELNDMSNAMFWASLLGLDTSALLAGSPLGDAEMALRMENLLRSLDAIEGERIDLERTIEDLELDIAFAEAIRPLEERLLALDYLADAFTKRAEAEREENEAIRDAILGEAEVAEAISASLGVTPVDVANVHHVELPTHLREPREVNLTVTLPKGKTSYTADEVADILRQQGSALGADTTVTGYTASEVTSTRRARII